MARKKNNLVQFKPRLVQLKTEDSPAFPLREFRTYETVAVSENLYSLGFKEGEKVSLEEISFFDDGDFIALLVADPIASGKASLYFGNGFSLGQSILLNEGLNNKPIAKREIYFIGKITNLK